MEVLRERVAKEHRTLPLDAFLLVLLVLSSCLALQRADWKPVQAASASWMGWGAVLMLGLSALVNLA